MTHAPKEEAPQQKLQPQPQKTKTKSEKEKKPEKPSEPEMIAIPLEEMEIPPHLQKTKSSS